MGLLPGLRYHILFVIHLAVTKDRQDVGKDEEDSCEAAAKEPFSFQFMKAIPKDSKNPKKESPRAAFLWFLKSLS